MMAFEMYWDPGLRVEPIVKRRVSCWILWSFRESCGGMVLKYWREDLRFQSGTFDSTKATNYDTFEFPSHLACWNGLMIEREK